MKLSKRMKRIVIIMGIIMVLLSSAYAVYEWRTPKYEEKEKTYYAYQSSGNIDYRVYLRPNVMYEQEYLEKDRYYVLDYIDHIKINFNYEFKGSHSANLNSNYIVKAYLKGLHGRENAVLWNREFVLIPEKTEQNEGTEKTIEITLPVNLNDYLAIKEIIFNDSEINCPVVLDVYFEIETLASTDKGSIKDTMSPNITIPIGENVFKIECAPELNGSDSITEKIRCILPVNTGKVTFLFIMSFIFLVMTILSAVFIKESVPLDSFDRTTARIFHEYGERLAGMEHPVTHQFSDVININSIDDMIKIADEIGQPVFYYQVNNSMERKIEFYVFDGSRIYYMAIFGEIKGDIKPKTENSMQTENDSPSL